MTDPKGPLTAMIDRRAATTEMTDHLDKTTVATIAHHAAMTTVAEIDPDAHMAAAVEADSAAVGPVVAVDLADPAADALAAVVAQAAEASEALEEIEIDPLGGLQNRKPPTQLITVN